MFRYQSSDVVGYCYNDKISCHYILKVTHTRLLSVGFRSWSLFLVVSLQVTWVINPAVDCHTFHQARSYPRNPQEGCYQFCCLVNRGTMGVTSLPKTVTRQRRGCDLNPGPSAPESSTLTTRLPSHPTIYSWTIYQCAKLSACVHDPAHDLVLSVLLLAAAGSLQ